MTHLYITEEIYLNEHPTKYEVNCLYLCITYRNVVSKSHDYLKYVYIVNRIQYT